MKPGIVEHAKVFLLSFEIKTWLTGKPSVLEVPAPFAVRRWSTQVNRLFVIAVSAAFLTAQSASAKLPSDIVARIRDIVNEEVAKSPTPGVSVSVVAEGRVVASLGAGLAVEESGARVTAETVFPAASLSKLITATLVMRQVERGNLALDRAANDYLESNDWIRDSAGQPAAATLRQLLTHSSGLAISVSRQMEMGPGGSVRSLSEYLSGGLRTIRPPGEKLVYSNEGFALLGYLAAQAEEESFEDHAQRVLFGPLGMSDSSFFVQSDMKPHLAELYEADGSRSERMDFSAAAPAGSLHTTVADLARFAMLQLSEGSFAGVRILSRESVREMMRLQATQHPSLPDGFGLGFGVQGEPNRRMVFWDGFVPGATSRLALLPDHGIGLAILTNSGSPMIVHAITKRVFDLFLGHTSLPSADTIAPVNEIVGEYRLIEMMEPAQWYVKWIPVISVENLNGRLELGSPFVDGSVVLRSIGPGRYRISGALFDGMTVLFEDGRMYVHMIEAHRVSPLGSSRAFIAYAAVFALLAASLIGYGSLRLIRWRRR